jgi:hemerythrin-like metal-binding protein
MGLIMKTIIDNPLHHDKEIQVIDKEHEELFRLLEKFEINQGAQIEGFLSDLTKAFYEHIETENSLFKLYGYPESNEHNYSHLMLMANLTYGSMDVQNSSNFGKQFMELLDKHISEFDQKFIEFLVEKKLIN